MINYKCICCHKLARTPSPTILSWGSLERARRRLAKSFLLAHLLSPYSFLTYKEKCRREREKGETEERGNTFSLQSGEKKARNLGENFHTLLSLLGLMLPLCVFKRGNFFWEVHKCWSCLLKWEPSTWKNSFSAQHWFQWTLKNKTQGVVCGYCVIKLRT